MLKIIEKINNNEYNMFKKIIIKNLSISKINQDEIISKLIKTNRYLMLKWLLKKEFKIKYSYLILSINYNRYNIIKLLIKNGINISLNNNYCLYLSIINNNYDVFKLLFNLIEFNSSLNYLLLKSIEINNYDIFKKLIKKIQPNADCLINALHNQNYNISKYIINNYNYDYNIIKQSFRNIIINNKFNIKFIKLFNKFYIKDEEIFYYCCKNNNLNIIKLIIINNLEFINKGLIIACVNNNLNIVKYLIEEYNADYNLTNCIKYAVEQTNIEIVKYLLLYDINYEPYFDYIVNNNLFSYLLTKNKWNNINLNRFINYKLKNSLNPYIENNWQKYLLLKKDIINKSKYFCQLKYLNYNS